MSEYRELGLATYGDKCEICGHSMVEVHHINYKLHQQEEDRIRKAIKKGEPIDQLIDNAKKLGFQYWDGHDLEKDNSSTNLSVLCSNCHTLIHRLDAGMSLLKVLSERK